MPQRPIDLNARRKRIRLSVKGLAILAGVDRGTVHRVLRGSGEHLASTLLKIEAAIAAEERRLVGDTLEQMARAVSGEVRP